MISSRKLSKDNNRKILLFVQLRKQIVILEVQEKKKNTKSVKYIFKVYSNADKIRGS
jgi:hypothetical protein